MRSSMHWKIRLNIELFNFNLANNTNKNIPHREIGGDFIVKQQGYGVPVRIFNALTGRVLI